VPYPFCVTLYRLGQVPQLDSPALIVAFDGWVDAGAAATTAANQVAEGGDVITTFDADALFDYRARRPALEILDGRPREITWPELAVRRARVGRRDVLVIAGPEPDYRWHDLCESVVDLAKRLGVVEWISVGAIPGAVPHTRPVRVMGTASSPDLLRGGVEAGPEGVLRVPAAALSVLEMAVSAAGIPAVGYFANVPHYVTGPCPAAAIELLRVLGRHLGAELPLGSLPDEARQIQARLDLAVAADESTRAHVARLEARVDAESQPTGDDLIADIERFLRDRGNEGSQRS
jgi:proteasome assembly chaperone (PAC2) family protein